MAQEPRQAPAPEKHPKIDGPGDDNKWKWLAGAAAAAVLLGGGYFAWQNSNQTDPNRTEIAAYDSDMDRAGPLTDEEREELERPEAQPAASGEQPARALDRSNRPQQRQAAAQRASAEPAEAVIDVGPTNIAYEASYVNEDDIIVEGRRAPIWQSTPNATRLADVYPAMALERGQEGEAQVQCTVQEGGAMDCTRISESDPTFGRAALRVARMFRHAPARADGSSAAGTAVNLRVHFRLAEDDGRRPRRL